ncbi:MAG: hypothetical protein ABS904_00085 [Solibacillus isronensis]
MIGKFSNTCVVSAPAYETLEIYDASVRKAAINVMEKVLTRLLDQGVVTFKLLADSSLNLEASDIIKHYKYGNDSGEEITDINIELHDAIPQSIRKFWLDNFATTSRLALVFDQGSIKPNNLTLMDLDRQMYEILYKGMDDKTEGVSNESKFKIIRSVYTLVTMNKPVTEDNLKESKHYYDEALFLMGMNKESFKQSIMSDIDSHYEEASKYILEATREAKAKMMYNKVEQAPPSETRKGILGTLAMMKAKSQKTMENESSKMEFEFTSDAFAIDDTEELTDEELKRTTENFSLLDSFSSDENMYSAFVQGSKTEELNALEKLSDKYAVELLKSLSEQSNLLINFYLQTTDQKYKALANQEGNKFCLNVDLKTGEVDLTLKGQAFKLTPFFPNGEEVRVNAHEW